MPVEEENWSAGSAEGRRTLGFLLAWGQDINKWGPPPPPYTYTVQSAFIPWPLIFSSMWV